jgi:hypothetical protein
MTMNRPATLALESLSQHEHSTSISPSTETYNASFDLSGLDHAMSSVCEPFPNISWSNDCVSPRPFLSSTRRKQLFLMSPKAANLKCKRRCSCDGYLVRCAEVFPSLAQISSSVHGYNSDSDVDLMEIDQEEMNHSPKSICNPTTTRRVSQATRVLSDSYDAVMVRVDFGSVP